MENIEVLLSNISETKHNSMIVEAYKMGSQALRDTMESANLQWDTVDKVLLDVQETIDSYKYIQDQLSASNLDELSTKDKEELEQELENLKNSVAEEISSKSKASATTKHKHVYNVLNNNNNILIADKDDDNQRQPLSDEQIVCEISKLEINTNSPTTVTKNSKEKPVPV